MEMNELKEIVEIIERAEIDVLQLEKGDFKLYYQKKGVKAPLLHDEKVTMDESKDTTDESDLMKETVVDATLKQADDYHQIISPMIGAFYLRSSPDVEPFVQVGSKVSENDPVCVLEAMKLLNEVNSDVTGEIMEVLVEDGQIIEYGQPLFTVKVSD